MPSLLIATLWLVATPGLVLAQEVDSAPEADVGAGADVTANEVAIPPDWMGAAGLVVVTSDETGQPVPGVVVLLRRGDADRALGAQTDERGVVEITGLAPGEWQLDIRREGFMLVTAFVKLELGKDPDIGFSSRQRTGSYWAPLEVSFLPPGVDVTPGMRVGRAGVDQERKQARREEQREAAADRRLQREIDRGRQARVLPSPEPEPEARTAAVSEPEAPAPRVVDRGASVEDIRATDIASPSAESDTQGRRQRAVVVTPEPDVAAPSAPPVTASGADAEPVGTPPTSALAAVDPPQAAPTLSTSRPNTGPSNTGRESPAPIEERPAASEPAPRPLPAAPEPVATSADAPPRMLRNPDLLPAGACPECRLGEWSVTARAAAAITPETAFCRDAARGDLEALASTIARGLDPRTAVFAGALRAEDSNDVLRLLPAADRAEVARRLDALQTADSCPVVGVVLPAGARYIGFRYQVSERNTTSECLMGQDCQVGEAAWRGEPVVLATDSVTVVIGTFENRSRRRERTALLTAYFQPQRSWLPPSQ